MDTQRLEQALIAADQAGDVDAATKLAKELRRAHTVASNPGEYDPSSPEFRKKYGAQGNLAQNLAAGAGKFLFDAARGLGQLTGFNSQGDIDEAKKLDKDLMSTTAGKVGNIVGGAAFSAPLAFVPGANTYAGAGLIGAGVGALQPTATGESRGVNTVLGAAGGVAGKGLSDVIGGIARRVPTRSTATATPGNAGASATARGSLNVRGSGGGSGFGHVGPDPSAGLTTTQRQVTQAGRRLGMRTTPGQASGSRALQQLEAKLESQPMTSGPFNAIKDTNQRVLNRAVARSIGESSDVVDSAVLARAQERLGGVFDDVADDAARRIDPDDFLTRLSDIEAEFEGLLPPDAGISAHPLVRRLLSYAERGELTGRQAQNLSSKLGKAATNQLTSASGDRELGRALFQVREIADDLLGQGLSGERLNAFQQARGQYRNFINLISRTGVVNPSTGNVSGGAYANMLQAKDRSGFLLGRNQSDAYNAARFAQAHKPIVGDSGTATRSGWNSPIDFLSSLPFNLATRAYTSSPSVALATGAGNVGSLLSPLARPIAPLTPYMLPGAGGLLGTYAAQQ